MAAKPHPKSAGSPQAAKKAARKTAPSRREQITSITPPAPREKPKLPEPVTDLFGRLSAQREKMTRVVLLTEDPQPDPQNKGQFLPVDPASALVFEIRPLNAAEQAEADNVLHSIIPPAKTIDEARPGTQGMTKVTVGYDYEHPEYIARRDRAMPKRWALVCLGGCPALNQSTPGEGSLAKADTLLSAIPEMVLSWLSDQILKLSFRELVTDEQVSAFFQSGSTATDS